MKLIQKLFFSLILIFLFSGQLFPALLEMNVDSVSGNDGNTGFNFNAANPAQTIQAAIDHIDNINNNNFSLVAENNSVVIYILNGPYTERAQIGVNGTDTFITGPDNTITIINQLGHAPVISGAGMGFDVHNSYTRLSGITVTAANEAGNTTGGINVDIGSNITITNCIVHNYSALGSGGPSGFFLYGTYNTLINCETYNERHTVSFQGSYLSIIGNHIHDSEVSGMRGSGDNLTISHNLIHTAPSGGRGIRLNGNCNDVDVFNNIIYNMGGSGAIRLDAVHNRTRIYNNTLYSNIRDGIEFSGGPFNDISIFNNLITHNGQAGIDAAGGGYTYTIIDYNNVYSNGLPNVTSSWGANNFSVNPSYISTNVGDLDFLKIRHTSLCIDAGAISGAMLTNDFWYNPRPWDSLAVPNNSSAYDVGADEYYGEVNNFATSAVTYLGSPETFLKPGYTVTFNISYNNPDINNPISNTIIRYGLPSALEHQSSSVTAGDFAIGFSGLNSPDQSYGSAQYGDPNDTSSRWVRWTQPFLDISEGETNSLIVNAILTNLYPAGTFLPNIFTSTGERWAPASNQIVNVSVGTLYGGRLSFADDRSSLDGITSSWTMYVTNKGNVQTTFNLGTQVCGTFNSVPGDWSFNFSTGALNLPIGGGGKFYPRSDPGIGR